ncbi:MAG: DUF1284 domain-containing protein [Planctomycetota bacterium]|jgi:hypothetical protein
MRLRAHNLLCIQGFLGKGYDAAFVANMTRVVESLDDATPVTVVAAPDALCAACPWLQQSGCALHGEGTETGIVHQDRDVSARLGIHDGETLPWAEIVARIARSVAPRDLDRICGACPWLPLGQCQAGLRRLRQRCRSS